MLYAFFGLLWILFSDQFLLLLTNDVDSLAKLQTLKGWFFIILTASLLFFLVRSALVAQGKGEESLQQSEIRFRTLLDTLPDLIWLKDADGVYLACNKMFERFFGAQEEEILGKTDYDFVATELADFFREYDRRAMVAGRPCANEEWITFADNGRCALLLTTKMPMQDEDGHVVGVLGIGHDITELREAEEKRLDLENQLHQAQKIESIGQLAGGVAHDFNNMLGVILGHAELARIKSARQQSVDADLEEICNAAKHSADLTRQLLTFARKGVVEPKVLDLNRTISGMSKMLQRLIGENIRLDWTPAAELWPVKIDPSQIGQILANLCVNARDAIDGSGQIVIRAENYSQTEAPTEVTRPDVLAVGDYVRFSVADDGRGIKPDIQAGIFEPFYTTKGVGAGTGMGLATVYGAVKQNDGFVIVESELGQGSSFYIYLPRTLEEVDDAETSAEDLPGSGSETILLVEDDSMLLNLVAEMLQEKGYVVLPTGSGKEALEVARTYEGTIHLLISDMVMPEINGRDLAQRIKDLRPQLKVLFMSGYTGDIISKQGIVEEGINFLQKPVEFEVLAAKVRDLLGDERS